MKIHSCQFWLTFLPPLMKIIENLSKTYKMPALTGNLTTTLMIIVNFCSPLAKTDIFSRCIVVERPKKCLLYLHKTPAQNVIVLPTQILMPHFNQSLFLSSTHVIPDLSTPYVIRPGGRRPPGMRQTSCRPPELGGRRFPVGCKPDHVHWLQNNAPVHSDQIGMGSPGQRQFLPGSPSPRYPTPYSPAMHSGDFCDLA